MVKAHIGVDDESGLVHTVISTAANISDISQLDKLLHGDEKRIGADAGYVGALKREAVQQKLETMSNAVRWYIAKRRKPIRQMMDSWQKDLALAFEKLKARYKGMMKNDAQLNTLFALSNLYMVRGKLRP